MAQAVKTKRDVVDLMLQRAPDLKTKHLATAAVEAFIAGVTELLKQDCVVRLTDFGNFRIVHREARTGVNPTTRERMTIPATNSIKFKASVALTRDCNR